MPRLAYLRRLAIVALIAGGLGAVAPAASAFATTAEPSATASHAPAHGPARTGGHCWNKPILPDWCQFDRA